MFTVAFDCDGTLLNYDGSLNQEMVNVLKYFYMSGARVIVWSGGGKQYAENVLYRILNSEKELEYSVEYYDKITATAKNNQLKPDLTFDDQVVYLGKFNCRIRYDETN